VKRLLDWSVRYSIDPDDWPAGAIAHRLARLCRPGAIAVCDAEDLKLLLEDVAGNPQPVVAEPAAIPFTQPHPPIAFPEKHFVLVGHFVSGLADCIENLRMRGGRIDESVTATTDFLVIGALRSQEWVNHSIRAEVEAALAATRRSGPAATPSAIISEASFLRAIGECRTTNSTHLPAQSGSAKDRLRGVLEHVGGGAGKQWIASVSLAFTLAKFAGPRC
jgi:hypothetical protein